MHLSKSSRYLPVRVQISLLDLQELLSSSPGVW